MAEQRKPTEQVVEAAETQPPAAVKPARKPQRKKPGPPSARRRSLNKDGTERKGRSDNWVPQGEQLDSLEAAAGIVKDLGQIAHIIGIHPQTLVRKMREYPEIRAAVERGRAKANFNVGKSLYINATEGKVVEAQKFWLKARAGWRDTERIEIGRGPDYDTYSDSDLEAEICEQEKLLELMEPVEGESALLLARLKTTSFK